MTTTTKTTEGDGEGLTEREKYLFDLNGYVIVRDVLRPEEVAALNASVTANSTLANHGEGSDGYTCRYKGFFEWRGENGHAELWRSLIDHPRVFGKLRDLLGGHGPHRLDHEYGMRMAAGCQGLPLHHGGTPYLPSCSYHVRDGAIVNGMVVAAFALTDVNRGDGGFVAVPGSHKSRFHLPSGLRSYAQLAADGALAQPAVKAGDVCLFSEVRAEAVYRHTYDLARIVHSCAHVQLCGTSTAVLSPRAAVCVAAFQSSIL